MNTILLTSFETWLPHQPFNSSDALLEKLESRWQGGHSKPPAPYRLLRRLPVDSDRALERITQAMGETSAPLIICCGMAENRNTLDLECRAYQEGHYLHTRLNVNALSQGLQPVHLSWDAGRFVCNRVYYGVLNLLLLEYPKAQGLFVHLPLLPRAQSVWPAAALGILTAFELVLVRSVLSLESLALSGF